jgi:hypothetical protein
VCTIQVIAAISRRSRGSVHTNAFVCFCQLGCSNETYIYIGVHATLDANNRVRFGPDVEWLAHETKPDEIDYQPDEIRGDSFYGMYV